MPLPTKETGFQPKETTEKKEFLPIPGDTYVAEIARAGFKSSATQANWPDFLTKKGINHQISFGYRITEGDYSGRWIWQNLPFFPVTSFDALKFPDLASDGNTELRLALQEIIGINPLPEDLEIEADELDELEGYNVRIRVNKWTSRDGKKEGNDVAEVLAPLSSDYEDVEQVF